IFGYQIFPGESPREGSVFDGAQPVEAPGYSSKPCQVQLFALPHSHVQTYFSQEQGLYCYVWGTPVHQEVAQSDISEWCAHVVEEKRYNLLTMLLGTFVVIVDEPARHRITFITDVLGIRPIFFGRSKGRLVFGSEVWAIQKAGLIGKGCDYDAISAWIAYGYNCTDDSLFADLRRMSPGSALIFEDNRCTEVPYAKFTPRHQRVSTQEAAAAIHSIVSSTVKVLLG